MILLGTAIIGNSRQALLQEGGTGTAVPGNAARAAGAMRVKQGDTVEGFKLAEVGDKRVIFSNGASRVELVLDYFRKVDARPATAAPAPAGQIRQPSPVAPRVVPALPRRQRTPMVYEGDSNS